jgi:ferredoxin-like protein FixX
MKQYSQDEIRNKFRQRNCLECETGKLQSMGTSSGGWVYIYKCDKCNTKYEFQETDMGQTLPYLESDAN